ncbi:MAG TPA: universal stress protein [Planctomycetota bacterium]|nr:universal stress protein [Planctomycetota bacterium]
MTRRILVPLDGSKEAETILSQVQRIAILRDEVHLLHLVPPLHSPVGLEPTHVLSLHEQASRYLEATRDRWLPGQEGLNLVRTGDPAEGILNLALEKNIELIAMSTHGRSRVAKMMMGSVASEVVRKAQLPVLLTRPDMALSSRRIRRILVSVEGLETPTELLETVKSLAGGSNAEIILFHADPIVPDPAPLWASPAASGIGSNRERHLQAMADDLEEQGFYAWPVVAVGDPVGQILAQAVKLDLDVIALATHGRSGLELILEGSVTASVLRKSPVAVLIQKPLVLHKAAVGGEAHE